LLLLGFRVALLEPAPCFAAGDLPVRIQVWEAFASSPELRDGGPRAGVPLGVIRARATPGEYEPAAFQMSAAEAIMGLEVFVEPLRHVQLGTLLPEGALDVHFVKEWYQASAHNVYKTPRRHLVAELLLKDDGLVRVDGSGEHNWLRVRRGNEQGWVRISAKGDRVPPGAWIEDANALRPLDLEAGTRRIVWLTFRVPSEAVAGLYRTLLQARAGGRVVASLPIELEVLPFRLSRPRLEIGLYYRGQLRGGEDVSREGVWKSGVRYEAELRDMFEHGIAYPTLYHWEPAGHTREMLLRELAVRDRIGFPRDRTYFYGMKLQDSDDPIVLERLRAEVEDWLRFFAATGRREVYFYGIDEARGRLLDAQRPAWLAVKRAGGRIFAAGNHEMSERVADLLDLAIVAEKLDAQQPPRFHAYGGRAFSYSNPQVGLENPEIYRRNYGLGLWRAGYDGAMTYGYNEAFGDPWNDFDGDGNPRDLMFGYPTDTGMVGTIQWEGFREAVDDLRYLATLQDRIDGLADVDKRARLDAWLSSLDVGRPLDTVRAELVAAILSLAEPGAQPERSGTAGSR
jgi:hypothetical protein